MTETWVPIDDWPGYYVSDQGRVCGGTQYCFVLPQHRHQRSGHWKIEFPVRGHNGRNRYVYVHQLVADAFIGPKPEGLICLHGSNGIDDNSPSNLSYGTHRQNRHDYLYRDGGTMPSMEPVPVIREDDDVLFESISQAARDIGVAPSTLSSALKFNRLCGGYTWRALT